MRGSDLVIATFGVAAQRDHLTQHPHTIMYEIDFASFVMTPAYRNLPQPQAGPLGKKEQLDIESETIHFPRSDNLPARLHAKCLETALCIPDRKAGCETHEQIKNAASLLTPPRLPMADQLAIEGT